MWADGPSKEQGVQEMSGVAQVYGSHDREKFFIDGAWVASQGSQVHHAVEAATGDPLGVAALGTEADIDAAVRAARTALDHGPWGRTSAGERAALMRRFADALAARARATSELVTRENGMPITLSEISNGVTPVALLRMYADLVEETPLEEVRKSLSGSTIVRREPVGVVGAITPWNYPQTLAMFKIAPALAAGCTIVLKPSPETALDSYVLGEAATEANLPPGVLNIVLAGREVSQSLVTHPLVDKISFTGSTAAGRLIGAECGRLVRRCTLELGGKSAAIFCADGDIKAFLAGLDATTFRNTSQTSTTQARILAPRSRYAEVTDALAQYCRNMVIGNPLDPSTTCGPMASEAHLHRVMFYIETGKNSAARLVVGGKRPSGIDRGWFVEPTVFVDVDNHDRLAHEEVFGPVIAVIPFDDDEDAVRIANNSNYGLAGSVWSQDEDRALGIARRVRTGTIGINYYSLDFGAPFGGMKESGIGRELGPQGLESYLEYKSIFASAAQLP
jgi:betaine-aldehyde dehydrogenase